MAPAHKRKIHAEGGKSKIKKATKKARDEEDLEKDPGGDYIPPEERAKAAKRAATAATARRVEAANPGLAQESDNGDVKPAAKPKLAQKRKNAGKKRALSLAKLQELDREEIPRLVRMEQKRLAFIAWTKQDHGVPEDDEQLRATPQVAITTPSSPSTEAPNLAGDDASQMIHDRSGHEDQVGTKEA